MKILSRPFPLLGRWLPPAASLLALLLASLIVAFDHHGAERIPAHGHLLAPGQTTAHVHGFERPHEHPEEASASSGESVVSLVRSEPAVIVTTFSILTALAIPSFLLFLAALPPGRPGVGPRGELADQTSLAPLLHPPPSPSA